MKNLASVLAALAWLVIQFQSIALGKERKSEQAPTSTVGGQIGARSQDPPLSAEDEALQEVTNRVRNNPANAPQITASAIRTDVPRPVPQACEIVRAAIVALGNQMTKILVARIFYAAVSVAPNETLQIESVAIQECPASFRQDVVSATLAAVPDLYDCVDPIRLKEPCRNTTIAANRHKIFPEVGPEFTPEIASEPCSGITLAEAIYQVALLNGATAADLLFNPNLGYTGDYGVTGIANDELINKQPPSTPTPTPVPTPSPTPKAVRTPPSTPSTPAPTPVSTLTPTPVPTPSPTPVPTPSPSPRGPPPTPTPVSP
jgi:hypothetical protein